MNDNDWVGIAGLLFCIGVCGFGVGYCTKQNRQEVEIDPLTACVKDKWASVEECKDLYKK